MSQITVNRIKAGSATDPTCIRNMQANSAECVVFVFLFLMWRNLVIILLNALLTGTYCDLKTNKEKVQELLPTIMKNVLMKS